MHKHIALALLMAVTIIGCQRSATVNPEESHAAAPTEPADNSYCYVCHINYKSEDITLAHEKIGVGCESCHGLSEDHSADENGLTAPDRMFASAKITPYCMTCHSEAALRKVRKHRSAVFTTVDKNKKLCTDCHGKHRLENRTRKWDKDTGDLVWKDGAPIMDQAATL